MDNLLWGRGFCLSQSRPSVTGELVDWCPMKVVVYVRATDARELQSEGKDPAEWVRTLVKRAFEKRKESRA